MFRSRDTRSKLALSKAQRAYITPRSRVKKKKSSSAIASTVNSSLSWCWPLASRTRHMEQGMLHMYEVSMQRDVWIQKTVGAKEREMERERREASGTRETHVTLECLTRRQVSSEMRAASIRRRGCSTFARAIVVAAVIVNIIIIIIMIIIVIIIHRRRRRRDP